MVQQNGHLLHVANLHLEREGYEILRGVNLDVDRSRVHALLGVNGSGKSTLAYALIGSAGYAPSEGEIWFDGEPISSWGITERARRGLTLAWQEPARFEGLTVARYISLGMRERNATQTRDALEAVDLPPDMYLSRLVDDALSGGERKRVELAAVYAMRPKLAILDEPGSGIDVLSLDDISRLIHRMAKEGTAVLLITHRDKVVAIADRASLICAGQIIATGDPAQICDRYVHYCRPCGRAEKAGTEVPRE